jgi:hypothetical protein
MPLQQLTKMTTPSNSDPLRTDHSPRRATTYHDESSLWNRSNYLLDPDFSLQVMTMTTSLEPLIEPELT